MWFLFFSDNSKLEELEVKLASPQSFGMSSMNPLEFEKVGMFKVGNVAYKYKNIHKGQSIYI